MEVEQKALTERTEIFYVQTTKVAEIFWEWRHKVMTRFFAATAGILVVAGWFYKTPELREWTFAPFFIGACFCVVSHLLDRVNTLVLRDCYRIAKEIEATMANGGGIFTCIEGIHYHKGSYHSVLRFVYLGTAVIFMLFGIAAIVITK